MQYLTAPFDEANATKHMINSTVQGSDITTGLRSPTRHGHPYWDEIFTDIAQVHAPSEASVFYSGPSSVGARLEDECKVASEKGAGVEFVFIHERSGF